MHFYADFNICIDRNIRGGVIYNQGKFTLNVIKGGMKIKWFLTKIKTK